MRSLFNLWKQISFVILMGLAGTAQAFGDFSLDNFERELLARHHEVIDKFKNLAGGGNLSFDGTLDLVREQISPLMDYGRFTSFAAGKYWRKFTPAQKAEAEKYFEIVLQNSYSKILSQYQDQAVKLVKSKVLPNDTVSIKMEISNGERTVNLNYIVDPVKRKVIDVRVEGISLLSAWRRQFNQTIKKDGVAGLLTQLKAAAQN